MDKWYDSQKWINLRNRILRRDDYIDQELKRYGKIRQAEVVHHIFPKNDFPEYAYEPWNLISVSRQTHNTFHYRDMDELSEKGVELLRRTCRRHQIPIPARYQEKKRRYAKKRDNYYGS